MNNKSGFVFSKLGGNSLGLPAHVWPAHELLLSRSNIEDEKFTAAYACCDLSGGGHARQDLSLLENITELCLCHV